MKECVHCKKDYEAIGNSKFCVSCKLNGIDKEYKRKSKMRYEKRTGYNMKYYYKNRKQKEIRGCIKRDLPVPEFYLNSREHPGMHAHHFLPRTIIYMPGDIHFSKHHSLKTKKNMIEMNELAISYLLNGV